MASSKEYLEFILGQLSELEEITYRAMMGEFIQLEQRMAELAAADAARTKKHHERHAATPEH